MLALSEVIIDTINHGYCFLTASGAIGSDVERCPRRRNNLRSPEARETTVATCSTGKRIISIERSNQQSAYYEKLTVDCAMKARRLFAYYVTAM